MSESHQVQSRSRRDDQDELLVAALAAGRRYAEAADVAGVSERTVRRRMSDADFARAVSVRRGELVGALTGQLVSAGQDAITVLQGCLHSDNAAAQIRAAHLLLTLGSQLRHTHELEQRIAALETRDEGTPS